MRTPTLAARNLPQKAGSKPCGFGGWISRSIALFFLGGPGTRSAEPSAWAKAVASTPATPLDLGPSIWESSLCAGASWLALGAGAGWLDDQRESDASGANATPRILVLRCCVGPASYLLPASYMVCKGKLRRAARSATGRVRIVSRPPERSLSLPCEQVDAAPHEMVCRILPWQRDPPPLGPRSDYT